MPYDDLLAAGLPVDMVVSRAARLTLLDETGLTLRDAHRRDDLTASLDPDRGTADLAYHPAGDVATGPSSGSYRTRGTVVVPASTAAAGIALGLPKDLLQPRRGRHAEGAPHARPWCRARRPARGAPAAPAVPARRRLGRVAGQLRVLRGTRDVQQLVDFVAAKVLDAIGVEHDLLRRWTGRLGAAREGRE